MIVKRKRCESQVLSDKYATSLRYRSKILQHVQRGPDSDLTQSGLDEEGMAYSGDEVTEESPKIQSPDDRTSSVEFRNRESFPQGESNYQEKITDSMILRDANLIDYIQSIIRLKSTTARLQQISTDHFAQAFRNPWESSPNTDSTNNSPYNFSTDKKQRGKIYLIRNLRIANQDHFEDNQFNDIVILETDESENSNLQSFQRVSADQSAPTNIVVASESVENFAADSGFGSEKPESVEAVNASQCVNENTNRERKTAIIESSNHLKRKENVSFSNARLLSGVKDRGEIFGAHTSRGSQIFGERSSLAGKNPLPGEICSRNPTAGERGSRKRKSNTAFEGDSRITTRKQPRPLVSSVTLNCDLRSSECNKVLLSSVKTILNVLENEENGSYDGKRNWHDSVKKEAIEAIVSTVDLLENEKGPGSCRREAVTTVKRVLEKMLFSSEDDKATVWEHQRLVILELCNASSVCTEVVNYLISELKKLIPVPMETSEESMKKSVMVMDKSYILFHALKIALKKYRSFAKPRMRATVDKEDGSNASENISEIADLWKRHWRVNKDVADVFVTGMKRLTIPDDPEKVWIEVLEKLVVVSTMVWPPVKILASQCLACLNSPSIGSPARDGCVTWNMGNRVD